MLKLNTKRILVPVDFSETSTFAIRHACFLARITRGEVLLLHIIAKNHETFNVIQSELQFDANMKTLAMAMEKKLEILAHEIREEFGIPVACEVSSGNVSMEIVKICKEEKCGLVVMGTQGYSALEMIFIGSNTMKVLGASSVPVMSVRSITNENGYRNVILPIDSSAHSRQKVNLAIELCHDYGAQLHVLGLSDGENSSFEMKLGVIFDQIAEIAESRKVFTTHKIISNSSNKAKSTLKYTEEVNGDLIIIMSDQEVEYTGIFLGPYASQVINYAKVPVLTVMPTQTSDIYFATPGTAGW
jgi:nucleotide-binding universal stress UspA family protein